MVTPGKYVSRQIRFVFRLRCKDGTESLHLAGLDLEPCRDLVPRKHGVGW